MSEALKPAVPYWASEDGDVTLHLGDCLNVLRTMGPASVDALVTDPPYGLEFMGREWDGADGFRRSLNEADAGRDSVFGRTSRTSPEYKTGKPGGARIRQASEADQTSGRAHNATTSLVARNAPEAYVAGPLFQRWCEAWARECLRVLKPGGWLLAFGGTRTWHRLTCGIEDAGFEIRDSTADLTGIDGPGLLWLYGSGFPKSLDVSKAIDKAADVQREVVGDGQPYGRGSMRNRSRAEMGYRPTELNPEGGAAQITVPATEDAACWSGWGTALKPSWEPIVVARKPLAAPEVNVVEMVELDLRRAGVTGVIAWISESAKSAGKLNREANSRPTEQPLAEVTSAAPAAESARRATASATGKLTGNEADSGGSTTPDGLLNIDASPPTNSERKSSQHTEAPALAAESPNQSSLSSTTSTVAGQPTESPSTERSTSNSAAKDSRPDTESFAGIATGLTGLLAHVPIRRTPEGLFIWPAGLPKLVPARPLTVARNVLEYGTGALNVDGCRVDLAGESWGGNKDNAHGNYSGKVFGEFGQQYAKPSNPAGRWPPNVVLGETAAAELDRQSGATVSRVGKPRRSEAPGDGYGMTHTGAEYDDAGGASRFFPVFRYEAKAGASERPRSADGTAHPTVKPVDLMAWLVRLVTPPGGVVLDPFAGSGTTAEACIIEGFRCVLIEQDPKSAELIKTRLSKPIQPTMLTVDDSAQPARPHPVAARPKPPPEAHPSLFDLEAS